MSSEKDDQETIEFEAGCDKAHKTFMLQVKSESPLKDIEFAACLRSFAEDIESGKFDFNDLHELPASVNH